MVQRFIRGLCLPPYLSLEYLIVTRTTFFQFIDHARNIDYACLQTYKGGSKSPHHQYSSSSVPYGDRDLFDRGHHHSQPTRYVQVSPHVKGDYHKGHSGRMDRFFIKYHEVLYLSLQAIVPTLGQQVHYIKEFLGHALIKGKLVIGLRSALELSQLSSWV